MTLDQLFGNDTLAPALVKIDVEGHEIGVLEGARGLIARRATTFIVEYHPHIISAYGRRAEELLGLFDDGWRLSQLTEAGLSPITTAAEIQPDDHDPNPKLVFEPA